eukprot:jgi/Astpho2/113/fgenesh1_pg.00004_%23_24_t
MGGCHSRLDGSRDTYRKSAERKRKQAFQEDSGGPSGMVELGCFDGDKDDVISIVADAGSDTTQWGPAHTKHRLAASSRQGSAVGPSQLTSANMSVSGRVTQWLQNGELKGASCTTMFTRRNSLLSAGSVTTAQTLPSISSSTLRQDSIGKSGMWDRYQAVYVPSPARSLTVPNPVPPGAQQFEIKDAGAHPRVHQIAQLCTSIFEVPLVVAAVASGPTNYIFVQQKGDQRLALDAQVWWQLCTWFSMPQDQEVKVIADCRQDVRFGDSPLVQGPPHVQFFASTPILSTTCERIGTLSILDWQPRGLDAAGAHVLVNLSELLMKDLNQDTGLCKPSRTSIHIQERRRQEGKDHAAVLFCSTTGPGWPILYVSDEWCKACGMLASSVLTQPLWILFEPQTCSEGLHTTHQAAPDRPFPITGDAMLQHLHQMVARESWFELVARRRDRPEVSFKMTFKPATHETIEEHSISIRVSSGRTLTTSYYFVTFVRLPAIPAGQSNPAWPPSSSAEVVACLPQASGPSLQAPKGEGLEDIQLGRLLGRGSFGRVYLAQYKGSPVAVKVLLPLVRKAARGPELPGQAHGTPPARPSVPSYKTDMHGESGNPLEATLLLNLQHPNILNIFKLANVMQQKGHPHNHVSVDEGPAPPGQHHTSDSAQSYDLQPMEVQTWIITEYCDQGALQDAIDKGRFRNMADNGAPQMAQILETGLEVAHGMAYLHQHDIVHGDLNANNVLLISSSKKEKGFECKVADFGLARDGFDMKSKVETQTMGTVTHMPPELLMEGLLTKAGDVWAFGVLMWELYTSSRAWAGMRRGQIISAVTILHQHPELPTGTPPAFVVSGLPAMLVVVPLSPASGGAKQDEPRCDGKAAEITVCRVEIDRSV